ncbi:hypothetical protein KBD34_04095 [Patescibacteria group bacterium]|nr:hypothetical protein [Patescibacteria group bacterium]
MFDWFSKPKEPERELFPARIVLNPAMRNALKEKYTQYKERVLAGERVMNAPQAADLPAGFVSNACKFSITEALLDGEANQEQLYRILVGRFAGRTGAKLFKREFLNAWGVVAAYNANDQAQLKGGTRPKV